MNVTRETALMTLLLSGCVLVPNEEHYLAEGGSEDGLDESEDGLGEGESESGECSSHEDCGPQESCVEGSCEPVPPDLGPLDELCNGLDDDDDDEIDEDYPELGDLCTVGVGACEVEGALVCSEDELATTCDAEPGEPAAEQCNGLDDDCDGETDEEVLNVCGDCGPDPVEQCNGLDDDCDGEADEDFAALGALCSVGVGACLSEGVEVCTLDGQGTQCDASPGVAVDEQCNGEDDDCDGETDEGVLNACGQCGPEPVEQCNGQDDDCDGINDEDFGNLGALCSVGVGACEANGVYMCTMDGQGTTCSAVPGVPGVESCNAQDDDCDGEIDEGVLNACGECGPVPAETCNDLDDDCDGEIDEGLLNTCGACGPVPAETCNDQDDDCDGAVDEGLACPYQDSFTAESLIELCPIHDTSDKEFDGNGPEVTASVEIYHSNTQVYAEIDAVWEETGSGTTKGEFHDDIVIWDVVPPGCTINAITSPTLSTCHYIDIDHSSDSCEPPEPDGPVALFTFIGDTGGDDLDDDGVDCNDTAVMTIDFQQVAVELVCP